MADTVPSAITLPAKNGSIQQSQSSSGAQVLKFSSSTKPSPALSSVPNKKVPSQDSEDMCSDPDDILTSQVVQHREQLRRDVVGPGLEKERQLKCGFLDKKAGGAGKTWNKRWCVLRPQSLSIYKNNNEYKLKRIIRLDEILTIDSLQKRNHPFAFVIGTTERSFYFEASSKQELEGWITFIRKAIEPFESAEAQVAHQKYQKCSSELHPQLSTSSYQNKYATSSRATSVSPIVNKEDAFLSLPSSTKAAAILPTSLAAAAAAAAASTSPRSVQSIFTSEDSGGTELKSPRTKALSVVLDQQPIRTRRTSTMTSGLHVDMSPSPICIPSTRSNTGYRTSDEPEIVSAFPPGIGPGNEVPAVDEDEDDGDDAEDEEDEPNFSAEQRREIEVKLAEDQVIMSGYLLKQDKLRQWRKRWFVLRRKTLSYYHNSKEYELKKILRPSDVYAIREPDPCTAKARSLRRGYFKIVTDKRSYWLAHDDIVQARAWFETLEQWKSQTLNVASSAQMPLGHPMSPKHPRHLSHSKTGSYTFSHPDQHGYNNSG